MAYTKETWEDSPSTASPIDAASLNHMETGIDEAHDLAETPASTFASFPAAGIAGRLRVATDQNGGTLYRDTGSAWEKIAAGVLETGGRELGYAEITSSSTHTTTTASQGSNPLTLQDVVPGARPFLVRVGAGHVQYSIASKQTSVYLQESVNGGAFVNIAAQLAHVTNVANARIPLALARRRPAPATPGDSYDYQVLLATAVNGETITLFADTGTFGGPAFIQAVEL